MGRLGQNPSSRGYATPTYATTRLTARETFGGTSKAGLGRHIGMGTFTYSAIVNGSSGHKAPPLAGNSFLAAYRAGYMASPEYPINKTNQLSRVGAGTTGGMTRTPADGVNLEQREMMQTRVDKPEPEPEPEAEPEAEPDNRSKILCLHGGGGSSDAFQQQQGMNHLINDLGNNYNFIFANTPHSGGIWFNDGKEGNIIENSTLAIESINYLDNFIQNNGPFYGILGYSQGVAMTLAYVTSSIGDPNAKIFEKMLLFNGYFPDYNLDLLNNLKNSSPIYKSHLIFAATNDSNFYQLSLNLQQYFNNPYLVESTIAGHALPTNNDPVYNDIINYISHIEFNDLTWNYETTPGDSQWYYNNEKQGYDINHANINANGELEITLTKEVGLSGNTVYKSSRLISYSTETNPVLKLEKGKFLSVEFEAKMPKAFDINNNEILNNNNDPYIPLWPALWMMGSGIWNDGTNQTWPYCGEIDVIEWSSAIQIGHTKYSNAIHYNDGIAYNNQYQSYSHDTYKNLTNNYHFYKTTISHPNNGVAKITMFFDGLEINSYELNEDKFDELYQTVDKNGKILDTSKHYGLIMNIALAGGYTGYQGDLNQFINDFPSFNKAIMYIKSINIIVENIVEGTPIDPNDPRSVKLMYGRVKPIELSAGNMPQHVIDIHQKAYIDYANKYNLWVGPLRFRYSTSENNISISGNPPIMYHYTSDTSLEIARKSALHEYTHLIQIANGAIQFINTSGGNATEQWQFMGPRWWSEGTAQWLVRAYSLNNNINIGQGNDFQEEMPNRIISYRNAVNNSIKPDGEKMTLRNVITPNITLNPDWKYVEQFNIYDTHVYDGGLVAIDFLMDEIRTEDKIQELFNVFKNTRIKNDWLIAFLEWSGYSTFDSFHDAFDQYIESKAPSPLSGEIVTVKTSQQWKSYVNAFNVSDGTLAFGFPYDVSKLRATATSNSMTLKPNIAIWNDEASNSDWFDQDASPKTANKFIEAISYIEDKSLAEQDLTFTGNVTVSNLGSEYKPVAFIKALDPNNDYIQVVNNFVSISNTGDFSVAATAEELTSGLIIQYGFAVRGPLAFFSFDTTLGSVVIGIA